MDRKSFLAMLPHLISAMDQCEEKEISSALSALEFSISKSSEGNNFYLHQMEGFSKFLPLASKVEEIFEEGTQSICDLLESLSWEILEKKKEPKILPISNILFDMASEPKDPKKFC